MSITTLRKVLVGIVVAAGLFFLFLPLGVGVLFGLLQGVAWRTPPVFEAAALSPRATRVGFAASDGTALVGAYAPPLPGKPVVIACHGIRADLRDQLPAGRILAAAGYGVLVFDWRAHGGSEGRLLSYGFREWMDLAGAIAFLTRENGGAAPVIGLMGTSYGAGSSAMAGPTLPDSVRAMVLDSPFGDLGRMAQRRIAALPESGPLLRLGVSLTSRLLMGTAPEAIVPERALVAFAPRPLLVLHGAKDTVIPVEESRSLVAAYPGPKEYWETPDDAHVGQRVTKTRTWMGKIAGFFARHLPGAPPFDAVLAVTPEHL